MPKKKKALPIDDTAPAADRARFFLGLAFTFIIIGLTGWLLFARSLLAP